MTILNKQHVANIARDINSSEKVKELINACDDLYIDFNKKIAVFDLPAKHIGLSAYKKEAAEAVKNYLEWDDFSVRFAIITQWK